MPWWLVFFVIGTIPLTKCNSPVALFFRTVAHSVCQYPTRPLTIYLINLPSSPSTLTSAISLSRNHLPSHKLDHSFVVNSRSRPTCNVFPVRPGIYELAHVSSQLNNSVLLAIWIFHWDSYRNQSDGSDGRTEVQCCKVSSICRWIALAVIQTSCDQRNIECVCVELLLLQPLSDSIKN